MNSIMFSRMQPIMRQSAMRFQAVKQPLQRQPLSRTSRPFHTTRSMRRAKEDEHSAHTITGRLRTLKKIPPELLPLGVVVGFAIAAAAFAMGKKLFTDKTLRLHKSSKSSH